MERAVFVYTTYPSIVEAEKAGRALVERRLAACVNILPGMISHYWWQGTIERGEEVVMIIKTRASLAEAVRAAVREHAFLHDAGHPRAAGRAVDPDYVAWLMAETGSRLDASRLHARGVCGERGGVVQYVAVLSITPLSSGIPGRSVAADRCDLCRKSSALRRLPCSACHMP